MIHCNADVDIEKITSVSKSLRHRGPDDEGYLLFNKSEFCHYSLNDLLDHQKTINSYAGVLIHRRLSVIDLSKGHQPMSYLNNKYWIVYNGEIYNYKIIRNYLKSNGYSFISDSDTEVVLAAYDFWGSQCVLHFNGMWAFTIYDIEKQILFASRDRFGIKPYYYYNNSRQFVFCSEMKIIKNLIPDKIEINQNKIKEFLFYGYVIVGKDEETVFKNILQLLPGHNLTLRIQDMDLRIEKYWELKINIFKNLHQTETLVRFKELFKNSINLRLISDVEVGSCLSGGIDSSSIVSLASQEFGITFNTFSAIWPGTRHDESHYIHAVNQKCKCKSNLIESQTTDLLELIDEIIWHQEIPINGSSLIAQWFVMKKARQENVPVLLDGQGADEILSGYPFYIPVYINELFMRLRWLNFFEDRDEWNHSGYSYLKIIKTIVKNRLCQFKACFPVSNEFEKEFKPDLSFQPLTKHNFLPSLLKLQIEKSILPSLLHYEDRNSMAHSVETRLPFLDFDLVDFTVNIPSVIKFKGARTKRILRESMKEYLPSEVYNRRDKIGFSTPIESQLSTNSILLKRMKFEIENSQLVSQNWIQLNKVDDKNIFALYALSRFLNLFS